MNLGRMNPYLVGDQIIAELIIKKESGEEKDAGEDLGAAHDVIHRLGMNRMGRKKEGRGKSEVAPFAP